MISQEEALAKLIGVIMIIGFDRRDKLRDVKLRQVDVKERRLFSSFGG